jgi:hypothetical protein
MQVFVPYPSPLDTAKCLDRQRLHKQIIECCQIIAAIEGRSSSWKKHPVTKMYTGHIDWLSRYRHCLEQYSTGNVTAAKWWSSEADAVRPDWLTEELCDQHKRRLFTKAPELYPQFEKYGKTEENWYVVDGKLTTYVNGKKNDSRNPRKAKKA